MNKQGVKPDDEKVMRDFAQILRELTNEDKRQVLGFAQGISTVRAISPATVPIQRPENARLARVERG